MDNTRLLIPNVSITSIEGERRLLPVCIIPTSSLCTTFDYMSSKRRRCKFIIISSHPLELVNQRSNNECRIYYSPRHDNLCTRIECSSYGNSPEVSVQTQNLFITLGKRIR